MKKKSDNIIIPDEQCKEFIIRTRKENIKKYIIRRKGERKGDNKNKKNTTGVNYLFIFKSRVYILRYYIGHMILHAHKMMMINTIF